MGNKATEEQKRQITQLGKEFEITLNGYAAEFTAGKETVTIFDVDTFDTVELSYQDFERGILLNNGNFKT